MEVLKGTLMVPAFLLILVLAGLTLFTKDSALAYTGASVYSILAGVTLIRKVKEILR